jgi:hypothetical protein
MPEPCVIRQWMNFLVLFHASEQIGFKVKSLRVELNHALAHPCATRLLHLPRSSPSTSRSIPILLNSPIWEPRPRIVTRKLDSLHKEFKQQDNRN